MTERTGVCPPAAAGWHAHPAGLCALSWSHDGQRLATGGNDGLIKVWRPREGTADLLLTLRGHDGAVRSLSWTPDDTLLASGAEDGTAVVWDSSTGERQATPQRNRRWVNAVAWSPDGKRLAAAGGDRRIVVTDRYGRPAAPPLHSPYGVFLSLAWSPDGASLAGTGRGSDLTVWDATDWTVRAAPAGPGSVWTVCWWRGGLATGNAAGRVRLWDARTLRPRELIDGHGGAVARVTASSDGEVIATLSHDQSIGVWDARTGRLLWRREDAYPGWTGCLEASPTAALLAGTDADGQEVRIWPLAPTAAAPPERPVSAYVRDALRDARQAGAGHLTLTEATRYLGAALPTRPKPEGWAEAELVRSADAGELALYGARVAALDTPWLRQLADLCVGATAAAEDDLHLLPTVERLLRDTPTVTGSRHASARTTAGLVGCQLVRSGRAWVRGTTHPGRLCVVDALPGTPDAPSAGHPAGPAEELRYAQDVDHSPAEVLSDVLNTTLFRRWAAGRHELTALTDDHHSVRVTATRAPGEGLTVRVAAEREADRDLLVALLARRIARARPGAAPPARRGIRMARPVPANLHEWDPAAVGVWALSRQDLPTRLDDRVAVVDEHIDDERLRQERLLLNDGFAGHEPPDVHIWHAPDDDRAAAELASELATLGLRTAYGEHDTARLVEATLPARTALLLITPSLSDWSACPLAGAYDQLTRVTRETGRRIRWLPVTVDAARLPADLPDHLHSFDRYRRGGVDPSTRRKNTHALLGGILVDRTRS
ncbi:WD40 repeat domain-containing protein [Streptomyces sp. WAC01526]|uniref:WD40 repeat domain-containing protein n=1 Tax=Streptomyces sp. WAC01526 TaxID=2588709 RepID=UPI0011DFB625|nr:WD40 repeat domain-containing protein [Streptomyces sp. WAC01526]MCW7985692.1 hypothetical protein [Streptomyces platensis subsp. clarensis]